MPDSLPDPAAPAVPRAGHAMRVETTIAGVRAARRLFPSIGLVPTMGFLHDGHLSLIRRARRECGAVAVSIFVNPTQFAPSEDLSRYPRDLPRDLEMLRGAGVDLVFVPEVAEMYPPGYATGVSVSGPVAEVLEAAVRPGHFAAVATVVTKLFNIVQPDRAYFGQKDAQQAAVIRKMARDLDMPLEVVIGNTVRDPDGVAMSSRNVYLSAADRVLAARLPAALRAVREAFAAGERDPDQLRSLLRLQLDDPAMLIDYASIADPDTLSELQAADARPGMRALALLAVRIGRTRLIDNLRLDLPG
ncbi:pantoate--beta-alanine ligase [Rhizosaccharibacter radicis]|uniref:Pantothenate synthetase n=1 Tax=Rhizosaccharibacter radicis TaxID=2782605 RepID=A0ABT1VWY2_9PROT|nr:pantoate--beta-alanine ligase [Acetobacteraceae bacterium KSS12]